MTQEPIRSSLQHSRPEQERETRKLRKRPSKPRRSKNWKPPGVRHKPIDLYVTVEFLAELEQPPACTVTIVSIHRPAKATYPHFERRLEGCDPREAALFRGLPPGHYLVVVQPRGFRPNVWQIVATPNQTRFELHMPPPHRARGEQEERVLIREGEAHPYLPHVRAFMQRFGYAQQVARSTGGCKDPLPVADAQSLDPGVGQMLRLFQERWGLEATGSLTVEALVQLQAPRCGHPDYTLESSAGPTGVDKSDPIVFTGNRWDDLNLRYLRLTGTSDITNEWAIIDDALDRWADRSALSFSRTTDASQSHLELDFFRPSDAGYPFDKGGDKDGNVLAHAWGPLNGTVEFDDHEDWGSTSLAAVATHEIGHALGLGHTSVGSATMYPWYDSGQASLHETDVRGIRSLYPHVYRHNGPFVTYPLFGFSNHGGTDSVTIDLGQMRHFLAWGSVTMIDSRANYDRDNWHGIDLYEIDGTRAGWRVSGGDHFGSGGAPSNIYPGARVGYGRRITFRLSVGHVSDLEVGGEAMVLVLS